MTQSKILAILVAIFSAGWLFPLWLGVETYLSFWRVEGWPRLLGENPGNSFTFFPFASSCFQLAFLWLGLVVTFWAYLGFTAYLRRRAA